MSTAVKRFLLKILPVLLFLYYSVTASSSGGDYLPLLALIPLGVDFSTDLSGKKPLAVYDSFDGPH